MTTQHTPGPWEVTNLDKDTITIVRRGVFTVAALWSSTQPRYEQEANARLIAAAPDLLAALTTITALSHLIPQPANHDGLQLADALAQARRAITAATGSRP